MINKDNKTPSNLFQSGKELKIIEKRTSEEIKEAFSQDRIAEMSDEVLERISKANQYFDKNPPKASSQEEIEKFFKSFNE